MNEMYEIGKWYKLETFAGLFFTACIISESETHIKFDTARNEQLVWSKQDIRRATLLERNEGEQ